jgi:WD40 repeat protein
VQTLAAGTERSYSCAVFSPDGAMLASVGSSPDYLLTLWDWASGATLLRCKAFSQEVYGVRFSPYFSGNLVTSGTRHIRFWRMADTFTGLKLQVRLRALPSP